MGLFKLIELLIILISISANCCYTLSPASKKWYPRDFSSDQDLRSLLDSIYDHLRRVESIEFRMDRFDTMLSRMSNKLDSFESHLNAVQTSMNYRISDLYGIVLKYDMQREQMIQKYETSQLRLLQNINKLETRFEDSFHKLQGNSEINLVKIENKQNELFNKVTEINISIESIKSHSLKVEDKINNTQSDFLQHFKNSQQQLATKYHLDKIENQINELHSRFNKTEIMWTQNDSPKGTNLEQQIVNDIKSEMRLEGQKIGNKVSNMYNEIWKKISLLENLIKENIAITNTTQKDIQEGLRTTFMEHREFEEFIDIVSDKTLTVLQTKITDLHHTVESNLRSLESAQNIISGACDVASGYGSRIELVLSKLVDTFYNKTEGLRRGNVDLLEALKGHNSQMIRTVSEAKNLVIGLAEENNFDHKALDNSIVKVGKKADIIAVTVEEVQDQLGDINGTLCTSGNQITQVQNHTKLSGAEDITESNQSNINTNVNALEANYNNGVIKIITDDIISRHDKRESVQDLNEKVTVIDLKTNASNKDDVEKLLYLNNALSTTKITGIISTSNSNKPNDENNTTNISIKTNIEKENENNISDKVNTDINKESTSLEDEDIETSLILSYINFIKGHITKDEFLQAAYPGKSFKSIQEMIAYLKSMKNVRNDYLRELDKYDREESESDNLGRSGDLFDNTNTEYEDSSDEFIS